MGRYYVHRSHVLPVSILNIEEIVTNIYIRSMQRKGYLMTSFEMRRIILDLWRKEDVWGACDMVIPLPSLKVQTVAIESESMDQYWMDIRPSETNYCVEGSLTGKKVECPICKEEKGCKISLHSCSCVFHRHCIETACKYSDRCPVCETTIYKVEG